MADAKITISATDLASDVFTRVAAALKDTGGAAGEASPHVETFSESVRKLGESWAARIAEGMLLRDAIHEVINVVKEGITSFPELVEHTIKVGNQLYEMSLKTGGSVENLSALRYVASQTGIDFESFGNTLFKMQQALGASGAKADEMAGTLGRLGLDMQELKNEKPDQAFIDIMSALEEIPNRADQAAVGMKVFGKGFKDMAGLTQESITDLIAEAQDLGLVMSTETAAAAHAAEIGFKGFSMQLEAVGMEVGATVLPALVALTKLVSGEFHSAVEGIGHPVVDLKQTVEDVILKMLDWSSAGISTAQFLDNAFQGTKAMLFDIEAKVVGVAEGFVNMALSAAEVANKIPGMRGDFNGLVDTLKDSSTWIGGFKDGLQAESDGAIDAAGKHAVLFDGLRAGIGDMKDHFHDAFTKAGDEITDYADKSKNAFGGVGADIEGAKDKVDKFKDAMADLESAGVSWQDTLALMDGAVVEATMTYLRAGVAANTLKEVYGLTATQVKALETAQKSYEATLKEVQRVEEAKNSTSLKALEDINIGQAKSNKQAMDDTVKSLDATQKLWVDYYDRVDAATLSNTDYKKLKVKEWFDDEVLKLKDDDANWNAHYDALYATAQQKMGEIETASTPYFQHVKTLLSDLQGGPGGWEDTFSQTLATTHSFHDAFKGVFDLVKKDVEAIFADMLANILKGFFAPLEAQLGGFLARLLGLGGGGGGSGWLAGLLGLFGGGGGSSTPITGGYFDGNGVWQPMPGVPGDGGYSGLPQDTDPRHEAEGGLIRASYMAAGGTVGFPGFASGIDRVPIWAAEGEGVLNRGAMRNIGEPMLTHLNRGGEMLNTRALEAKLDENTRHLKNLGDRIERALTMQPQMLRHAMRGA